MIDRVLMDAVLRDLASGVAIWRLEYPADATRLRLLLANPAAARWAGVDLGAGVGALIGEIDPRAVAERRHEVLAQVAATGLAASIAASAARETANVLPRH